MKTIKKILKWISHNFKLFLFILGVIVFVILIFWWGFKNRTIRKLKNQLAIANAKLQLEKLRMKYDVDMEKLKELKTKDGKVKAEIATIEKSLEERLKPDMTADEIVAKFKEMGFRE
jgi:hypothetical protein